MNKVLLLLCVAVLMVSTANAQLSYGVKAGVNTGKVSNMGKDIYGGSLEDYESTLFSYHLTGYVDLPLLSNFSVQPGISLQGKGAKFSGTTGNYDGSLVRNVVSIEIPVNLVHSIPVGDAGSVFVGAGPYVGYAISAKDRAFKNYIQLLDREVSRRLKLSGEDKDIEAFDAGINFLVGFKTAGGFLVNANYGLGLMDLNPSHTHGEAWHNRVLSFGIGYQF